MCADLRELDMKNWACSYIFFVTKNSLLFSHILTLQVFDVTAFMDEHPGGDEVLLAATGNNSNQLFVELYILYVSRFLSCIFSPILI